MITAILAFTTAGAIAWLLTPVTGRLARRFGVIDHPSQDETSHKKHSEPTPYLGGIAISLAVVAGSSFVFFVAEGIPIKHFVLTIGAGVGLGLVGLLDDIRPLPRSFRLFAQVIVALGAWSTGFGVSSAPNEALNLTLTIFWLVGITNAFNLLDNMDGVSAGLAGIAALTFAGMGLMSGLPVLPIVAAALSGAAFGFLVHNRHPAKVFMGDAGSLFLGFLVALIGLRLRFDNLPEVTFLVPVVVLAVPIVDTTLVVASRLGHRRPVFLGSRDHVTHRLVLIGFSIPSAVTALYLAALAFAGFGVLISRSGQDIGLLLVGFVVLVCAVIGGFLARVPVYGQPHPDSLRRTASTPPADPMTPEPNDEMGAKRMAREANP